MSNTSYTTGKEKIAHLESLTNDSKLYTCVRILKSNYDQIGTNTSIKPQILLENNIRHFKSNDARISEIKHLTQCLTQIDQVNNKDLVDEIKKQLGIYNSVSTIQGEKTPKRKTQRKYKKTNRKHKKSRKH